MTGGTVARGALHATRTCAGRRRRDDAVAAGERPRPRGAGAGFVRIKAGRWPGWFVVL